MSRRKAATGLTNVEVLTYVLADLGGLESAVHLEHIAARAFELMPGAFRWDLDEFANLIDKDKVRISLTDAEKASHGRLVRAAGVTRAGKSKKTDYWRLTSAGSEWVSAEGTRVADALAGPRPGLKKGRATELRNRVERSALYHRYIRDGGVEYSPFDFADLLECSPDASNRIVSDHFDAFRSQVALLGDDDLDGFLSACATAHARMLEISC